MHNCKATSSRLFELAVRSRLFELAVDETLPDEDQRLWAELAQCSACREEYASLRNALRVADQAMQSALPGESFWSGYHARLRARLEDSSTSTVASHTARPRLGGGLLSGLRKIATAYVRVPVPVAAVLILFLGVSSVLAVNWRRSLNAQKLVDVPTVITKTVEVPVVQEKIVTRVVYRDRNQTAGRRSVNAVAGSEKRTPGETPASLIGFKPTNEVNLTIIKGSYRDEK